MNLNNCGEKEVISQADRYQKNAKVFFKDKAFYHIIIIRSEKLGLALKDKINKIKEKNLTNLAILCSNNKLKLFGKEFSEKSEESKESSKKSKKPKTSSIVLKSETHSSNAKEEIKQLRNEFTLLKNSVKNSIEELKTFMTNSINQMNDVLNSLTEQLKTMNKNNDNSNNNSK